MTYSKLARDPLWSCVVDVKDFDAAQTSVVRVFQHASGFAYVFAQHGTGKEVDASVLEPVGASVVDTVKRAAASAKISDKALASALTALGR
jgi:hypothetical protein